MGDIGKEIEELKFTQKEMMRDIRTLEIRTTITEKDILTINKQLEKISMNTTWILRIVIGAVVTGILGLVIKIM
ncbi:MULTISPECIES: hemolysin XhlA family protein [Bacillus]|uniref:hemolysin XhlA family protein n=1 Tax=Bacillus TaxID=1386 RepID=UPI0011A84C42|nr:hemolysin XhlA family protein [Bacillus thuringiensis]MCQ6306923.1 hemolysin XhlA family protein [Bacillus cereus]HEF1857202.1 hemolysin XhlA family protein [Bacillus cereus]HEF1866593.1 hemolysin XhlA family protein [Bacillus cereus]HEF1880117.1 hemolysin XhlA family protein [Bacillus cereus]HEF1886184.1 hemolysin XhlA family protein [Bacillus cereus]